MWTLGHYNNSVHFWFRKIIGVCEILRCATWYLQDIFFFTNTHLLSILWTLFYTCSINLKHYGAHDGYFECLILKVLLSIGQRKVWFFLFKGTEIDPFKWFKTRLDMLHNPKNAFSAERWNCTYEDFCK